MQKEQTPRHKGSRMTGSRQVGRSRGELGRGWKGAGVGHGEVGGSQEGLCQRPQSGPPLVPTRILEASFSQWGWRAEGPGVHLSGLADFSKRQTGQCWPPSVGWRVGSLTAPRQGVQPQRGQAGRAQRLLGELWPGAGQAPGPSRRLCPPCALHLPVSGSQFLLPWQPPSLQFPGPKVGLRGWSQRHPEH